MSAPLWTTQEILTATGATAQGAVTDAAGVSIDTRTLAPGDLFFAIMGDARDGHDFVRNAWEKGATAVIAQTRAQDFAQGGPAFVVPDVLGALSDLARAARNRTSARIAAITGSVGKTGTKEALRLVLSEQGETHSSAASYNNHWGVPLSLARMPGPSAFGVFEIGMNHSGEIVPLAAHVRPHVAVVTTIEPVHIEHFPSLAAIADAKGEIFSGLKPGGVAVINRDNPYFERLKAHAAASPAGRIVTFGEHDEADVCAKRIILQPDMSIVEAHVFGEDVTYRIGTPGKHIVLNSLSVLATATLLGADMALAALTLADLKPAAGRGERTMLVLGEGPSKGEVLLIDESYNANPASMRAAFATLGAAHVGRGGRRIAVLGDMLELGAQAQDLHRELAEPLVANKIDLLFAAGSLMQSLVETIPAARLGRHADRSADLVDDILKTVRPGDAIMIKGSNSTRMAVIVAALKERFSPQVGLTTDLKT